MRMLESKGPLANISASGALDLTFASRASGPVGSECQIRIICPLHVAPDVKKPRQLGISRISGDRDMALRVWCWVRLLCADFKRFGSIGGDWTRQGRNMAGPELRNGRPIYQPLSPMQEARFFREMEICEAVWRETGEPLAVTYALTLVYLHAQTIPALAGIGASRSQPTTPHRRASESPSRGYA